MTNELFTSEEWAEVLRRAYDFEVHRAATAHLPYVALNDLAGRRVSCLPFADYLPIDDADRCGGLLRELSGAHPDSALILKTRLPSSEVPTPFTVSRRAVYHRYFPGGKSSSSFRRNTRKATGARTRVQRSTDEDALGRFLEIYHWQRLRKFGSIPQPASFFRAIHDIFMASGRGFYAEAFTANGHHAATLVVLQSGRGWFYKFGASHPDHLAARPNDLLFTHLTEAVDDGEADFLDLGLSGAGEAYAGLRRFKDGTGATSFPLSYLSYPPAAQAKGGKPFKQFLGELTTELVNMDAPPAMVDPLSQKIYRYFA